MLSGLVMKSSLFDDDSLSLVSLWLFGKGDSINWGDVVCSLSVNGLWWGCLKEGSVENKSMDIFWGEALYIIQKLC